MRRVHNGDTRINPSKTESFFQKKHLGVWLCVSAVLAIPLFAGIGVSGEAGTELSNVTQSLEESSGLRVDNLISVYNVDSSQLKKAVTSERESAEGEEEKALRADANDTMGAINSLKENDTVFVRGQDKDSSDDTRYWYIVELTKDNDVGTASKMFTSNYETDRMMEKMSNTILED